MNYIDNVFQFYDTTESFELHKKQGLISPDSICFLRETSQIYTQNNLFGICRERFLTLEQLVQGHEAKINNILGVEGPSVGDGIVNNITDLVTFLDGFTDEDNLKEFLDNLEEVLRTEIVAMKNYLYAEIEELSYKVKKNTEDINSAMNRLDSHESSITTLTVSLNSLLNDYHNLNDRLISFVDYATTRFDNVDGKISSIIISINNITSDISALNRKYDSITNDVEQIRELFRTNQESIAELRTQFGEALTGIEAFKREIVNDIETFKDTVGRANGIAPLDENGLVPSIHLPSYVDDVLEYATKGTFPIKGETGKIYVALDDNLTYRWSGSAYVEISKSLALGETSSTAYPGDKGKSTTDSLNAHKVDYNNPHNVTKAQVGLGLVDNTRDIDKPISTAVQVALNNKVEIEPGKSLVSLEDALKIEDTARKMTEYEDALASEINRAITSEQEIASLLAIHKSDNTNPHGVTKEQVGLGNVDNTADIDKPVSTQVQELFDTIESIPDGDLISILV